jgi:hypothetical protein
MRVRKRFTVNDRVQEMIMVGTESIGKYVTMTRKLTYGVQVQKVRVLAIDGLYAMVRIKGAVPFVCRTKELEP